MSGNVTASIKEQVGGESLASGPRYVGPALLMVTVFGWGINWPVMKLLLAEWPPLFSRGSSGLVAGLGIGLFACIQGEKLSVPAGSRAHMVIASLFNVTAWMGLATLAMSWLSVGEAAMIIYTMPIWANLLAWPISGTKPKIGGVLALLLGMAGIAVLLAGQSFEMKTDKLLGVVCAFSAAVLFAISTITIRPPAGVAPISGTGWQLAIGSLPLLLLGIFVEQPESYTLSTVALWSWLYMSIVAMAVCYFCWFAALRRLPPTVASIGTMLIPVIGTISAAYLLGEPFGVREAIALSLVIAGIGLALTRV